MGAFRGADEVEEGEDGELEVLVVEDETADAQFALDALEAGGLPVDVEATPYGERALELVANRSFDAILLDHRLPRMDGTEFLEELRGHEHEIPVVVLTGRGSEELETELREAGADAYLEKDTSDDESLRETLAAVLETEDELVSR